MTFGTCPQCKKTVPKPRIEHVMIADASVGMDWKGVNYSCPSCNCILGVSVDPLAIKDELVKELRRLLGR
jgi:hypothetical protein